MIMEFVRNEFRWKSQFPNVLSTNFKVYLELAAIATSLLSSALQVMRILSWVGDGRMEYQTRRP